VEASGKVAAPDGHIVEYPFVISKLNSGKKGKVLDIGCTAGTNCVPAILASLGWDVYGIDLREFKFRHPNFRFVLGDITRTPFPNNYFDYVYEISSLEHVGRSGRYGISTEDIDGDLKAVNEITRILRPGGKLIVIEAYGRSEKIIKRIGRIYNRNRLKRMFSSYEVLDEVFFTNAGDGYWKSIPEKTAQEIGDKKYNGVLILLEMILKEKS
jgi:SAM-dependent methyltransferase